MDFGFNHVIQNDNRVMKSFDSFRILIGLLITKKCLFENNSSLNFYAP